MNVLLDTNVVSEAMAARPDAGVLAWIRAQPDVAIHLSVATIAEIDYGISRLPDGHKRVALQTWRENVVQISRRRILPVDLAVASAWGKLRGRAEAARRTMSLIDALIAATAEVHDLTLVTRNVKDFEVWGGPVFNPWPAQDI